MNRLPNPRVFWIESDPDRIGRLLVAVDCPVCLRMHRHDFTVDEPRPIQRVPHCLRRLDVEAETYAIDFNRPDGEAA